MATDPAKLLKQYQDEGYNILTPSITLEGLSPNHRATVETVALSHDPEDGDVYKDPNADKRYIVSKQGLDKLAVLAGVLWPDKEGSRRIDDGKKKDYIAFEAFGAIRKADGQLVPVKAFYDMDLDAIEDDLRFNYRAKGMRYKKTGEELEEYVEFCTGRDIRSIRKHKATRCESGARNRVIRALLGLKKKYTTAELKKPFVCIRVTYQPDYEDPEIKKLITMISLGAQSNVFGLTAPQPQLPSPSANNSQYEEVVPADPFQPDDEHGDEPVQTEEDDAIQDAELAEEDVDEGEADFGLWDRKSQVQQIEKLAKRKDYDFTGLLKRMDKKAMDLDDIQIIQIYDKLNTMPDAEPADIPW